MYNNKNSISGENDITLIRINYITTEGCGLVVLGDAQDMLSVRSKVQIWIWIHLGYLS